jgi:hypothetical protein
MRSPKRSDAKSERGTVISTSKLLDVFISFAIQTSSFEYLTKK